MRNLAYSDAITDEIANCPYCNAQTGIRLPGNYAPVFAICEACAAKFIAERLASGFQVMTLEEAPLCSRPDCREIELGAGDEE